MAREVGSNRLVLEKYERATVQMTERGDVVVEVEHFVHGNDEEPPHWAERYSEPLRFIGVVEISFEPDEED